MVPEAGRAEEAQRAAGLTLLDLIVDYVGIVPAQPIYLLPSLGFQVRFIKGRGPAPCLFFKTSDR